VKNYFFLFLILLFAACGKGQHAKNNTKSIQIVNIPAFSADSAYKYIQAQVDFGPRVPNTAGHRDCADYLIEKLKSFGAEVTEQRVDLKAFDGTMLKAVNIIGTFNPQASKRVLLFAHWDTRPWADNDPNPTNWNTPVLGANDGASGVGILLETARQLSIQPTEIGIDILFFDAEDYGQPSEASPHIEDTWAMGSNYWSKHPHKPGYRANYGILLDMTGAPNATFMREAYSDYFAPHIVNKIWSTAESLGLSNYFRDERGGSILDDHYYINVNTGIPCADIIQHDPTGATGFGHYWHTINDDMSNIDKNTLQAVGTTLLHVIYNEQ
jgi:hypothetical protein